MEEKCELHTLGLFVHGVLAGFHALGVVYNIKHKNFGQAAIHAGVMAYDIWAAHQHAQELEVAREDIALPAVVLAAGRCC